MNELFRNTLGPWQWAAMLAIPPAILALYFLKLKRVPVVVPSTYLWTKAIEDLRVNSLWQRMRKSLLLLLQLLLVALAILALLRPGWRGAELSGQRLIFLVDNSASMTTTDAGDDGESPRLDAAKVQVAGLIDQMRSGMTAMIISFGGDARVVQEFTDNGRLLHQRLESIAATAESTDLLGALELADGLANPAQMTIQEGAPEVDVVDPIAATLFIFSDGRFSDVKDFALGNLEPVYVPIGEPGTANLAITAFQTRRDELLRTQLQAFVQVANLSDAAAEAVVEIRRDGSLVDAKRVAVAAGATAGVVFPLGEAAAGGLTAQFDQETLASVGDRLAVDNTAYAAINDARPGAVLLVTPGNVAVETALASTRVDRLGGVRVTKPDFLQEAEYQRDAEAGAYDLVIFDRCAPEASPRASTIYLGALPPGPAWRSDGDGDEQDEPGEPATVDWPQLIDWSRTHPLLAHIELGNFDVVESLKLDPPSGGSSLIDSASGSVAAIAPRGGYEDLVLGFPILVESDGRTQKNTDWINRHSFPTFWLNAVEYFVAQASLTAERPQPGEPVELRPLGRAEAATLIAPNGRTEQLTRTGDEPYIVHNTADPGVYTIDEGEAAGGDRLSQRFAVNLFDQAESDVRLRAATAGDEQDARTAAIRIGNIDVAAQAGSTPARQEIWRPLLLAALVVLLIEWYVYNRRVYV
ncbi:hypothetical protein Mal64_18230 [Pseudobythopirellula maris]|uniref:VWFA domain-containing protein n=1 Tax=Pseudobythopirellula maris TaxID=2527991 RepID=A0A5C5ZLL2_9BACT|nr:BatA and WFA domain-containing protein [Pseudobythopirellula maris]TWT88344.1 hypothetical protein Mal64_18230 [Pseudobythopirellula maris]